MNLSPEDILKPDALPVQKVHVPEWGGDVHVATLRADERDTLEMRLIDLKEQKDGAGIRAYIVATCLCDENGRRLFAMELEQAAAAIGQKAAPGVQRVFNVASKINGITSSDMEELEKN